MTKAHVPTVAERPVAPIHPFGVTDLRLEKDDLRAELEDLQPLVSAAVLTATAFRLRDHDALITALRLLVRVTRGLEERHVCV